MNTSPNTSSKLTSGQALTVGRFVALAFCRADILFQVAEDGTIKFCTGPSQKLFGKADSDLVGENFLNLVNDADRNIISTLFASDQQDARIDDILIRAASVSGAEKDVSISGYRVPDFENDFFLAMKIAPKIVVPPGRRTEDRDSTSGVMAGDAYVDVAAQRIKSFEASGGKPKVSMLNIGDLAGAGIEAGSQEEREILSAIGDVLNAESLGGDTAGRIDDENFSLVHGDEVSAVSLSAKVSEALAKTSSNASRLMPKVATMDAGASGMDEKQLAKAMLFSLQEFTREGGELPDGDLATALERGLEENVKSMESFKKICSDGSFDLVYMPVCHLSDSTVHHYEALTRFRDNPDASPFRLLTLAEETGMISEFDLLVAERAIECVEAARKRGPCTPVAINVSGHSISNAEFCESLAALLDVHFGIENFISLEITESAEIIDLEGVNSAIQIFRRKGFKVALDDFGAGAASFDYLNSFDVDTVKFDGPVVKRAIATRKGKAFLASMATLCHEIDVETIAEMVEDATRADFLRLCGIELGQGWHFGKPMPESEAFPGAEDDTPPAPPQSAAPIESERPLSLMERLNAGKA